MKTVTGKKKAIPAKSEDEVQEEDYRKKRDRNNQAVKRSRVKSKQKTQETQSRVEELRLKNKKLEGKIEALKSELKHLKGFFLTLANTKMDKLQEMDFKKLLTDDDEEEEDDDDDDEDMEDSSDVNTATAKGKQR